MHRPLDCFKSVRSLHWSLHPGWSSWSVQECLKQAKGLRRACLKLVLKWEKYQVHVWKNVWFEYSLFKQNWMEKSFSGLYDYCAVTRNTTVHCVTSHKMPCWSQSSRTTEPESAYTVFKKKRFLVITALSTCNLSQSLKLIRWMQNAILCVAYLESHAIGPCHRLCHKTAYTVNQKHNIPVFISSERKLSVE